MVKLLQQLPTFFWRTAVMPLAVFPCPGCGSAAGRGRNSFCADCRKLLPPIAAPHCPGCGGRLDGILQCCSKCVNIGPRPWREAYAGLEFRGYARDLLLRFKYSNVPELAHPFAELLAEYHPEAAQAADGLVPIPLHYLRYWKRSYNQAELLARELGRHWHLPVLPVLRRVRPVLRQAGLTREQRLSNLKGAFRLRRRPDLAGRRLLVIDDVFTTGATLTAAVKLLQSAGAAEIRVLTLARR